MALVASEMALSCVPVLQGRADNRQPRVALPFPKEYSPPSAVPRSAFHAKARVSDIPIDCVRCSVGRESIAFFVNLRRGIN